LEHSVKSERHAGYNWGEPIPMRRRRSRDAPPDELALLARQAQQGRPTEVRAFLTAVAPLVLRAVRQVLGGGHPDEEDIVQEALVGTLDALPRFRGACSMAHFVRRIGLLTALNARRRFSLRRQIAPPAYETDADSLPASGNSPAENVDAERRRALFLALLDELPAAQAEAIGLHCVLGYTVAETAAAAGVPVNTVRGRLVAAKAALRQRLAEDSGVDELLRGAS
jgi:RNA polymerase sigma-70 factor (ECF subfamily)